MAGTGPQMYDNNAQSSVPSSAPSGGTNTVMDSLGAAITAANNQVSAASKQVQDTPMYTRQNASQPTMPVPSLKGQLFAGASPNNLANKNPQTAAGARSKAIGQLAGLGAQTVGKYFQHKEAEKTQALAIDIHKSLELQQGIDEANQVLKQDPNNADAKASLQKNQTLLTALLNGKSGKDIAKSYSVVFGEEAKDMSPEKQKDSMHHKAMTDAMKQKKQDDEKAALASRGESRMSQFEAQQPSRMAPNPQYAAAQKSLDEVQKRATDLTKTYTTLAAALDRSEATRYAADQRVKSSEITQEGANARTDATNQTRADIENSKESAAMKEIDARHKAKLSEIGAQGAARLKEVQAAKGAQGQIEGAKAAYTQTTGEIKEIQGLIAKQQGLLSKDNKDTANDAPIKEEIQGLNDQLKVLKGQQDTYLMYMFNDPDAVGVMNLTNSKNLEDF